MPECGNCRAEHERGATRCPECGGALESDGKATRERGHPMVDSEPVRLCALADPTEAEIIQALLRQAGINSVIHTFGPLTGELTRVADGATHDYSIILVSKNRLAEARAALEEIQSGPITWPEGMEPED